jgi:hypothetical protein
MKGSNFAFCTRRPRNFRRTVRYVDCAYGFRSFHNDRPRVIAQCGEPSVFSPSQNLGLDPNFASRTRGMPAFAEASARHFLPEAKNGGLYWSLSL